MKRKKKKLKKIYSIKSKRTKPKKSNKRPKKITKRKSKTKKSIKSKRRKTKFKKNKTKFNRSKREKKQKTRAVISSLLSLSDKVKSMLRFNLNLDQSLQNFFQGISNRVSNIKKVIQEERAKQKENKIKEMEREKIEARKRFMQQEEIALKAKTLELKEEKELSRQLSIDLKRFLREDQAELRRELKDSDTKEILLEKERVYNEEREKVEYALESFYRASHSLCFMISKRYLSKHLPIMRCIDKRIEESSIYIKWDDTPENEWLICIYLKDDSPTQGIVIEDKTDPEKNISKEFKRDQIFDASDFMVDSLTALLDRERNKRKAS